MYVDDRAAVLRRRQFEPTGRMRMRIRKKIRTSPLIIGGALLVNCPNHDARSPQKKSCREHCFSGGAKVSTASDTSATTRLYADGASARPTEQRDKAGAGKRRLAPRHVFVQYPESPTAAADKPPDVTQHLQQGTACTAASGSWLLYPIPYRL